MLVVMKLTPPEAKRVVYVSPYYDPAVISGANRRFDEMTRRFARDLGADFTLIVAKGKAPAWWTCESNGAQLVEVNYKFNHASKFTAAREIARTLNAMSPSIVIIESVPIPYAALKRHAHFQVVYDFRYFTGDSKSALYRAVFAPYLRRQWSRAEFMVTCSEFSIQELKKYVGFDEGHVVKSFFGIPEQLVDEGDTPLPQKELDIFYAAHFEKRKNHEPLIRAMALVDKNMKALFTGADNGLRAELETLAKALGLTNIRFGRISDTELWESYRKTRLYASPSVYEGFGIPVIESLALGTPVIASDLPFSHEVGGDLITYFDPHSPEDIARAIREQLAHPAIASREAVRAHMQQFFWENIYKKFEEDLRSLATGKPAANS
jgi:glycosyltransferase involved in cell wall biosynthesis